MKTIGIIGGMSWESSAQYYALINRTMRERLGAPHSANILMDSLDFGPVAEAQASGDWDQLADTLIQSAENLEAGGADCIVLATNTMHKVADAVEEAVDLPFIHIADSAADAVCDAGIIKIGLLGTAFTMEEPFYKERLEEHHGLDVVIPEAQDRAEVHRVIFEELVAGQIIDESREAIRDIITRLVDEGAQGVILGCTEIGLLIDQSDSAVPLFDTTQLHAHAAVEFALTQ
ncbi:MAG: aspartate/glutamate racemase family protein [Erythrobacter sp.]|uniref:aspartate/glutamate racemase family protein n=1 Tax=Erythrobacter sp. TaxID=1042 RepID=UPI0032980E37